MLITLLTLLIISNALSLRKDKTILLPRVVMVSLIHTSFLAYNNLFILPLDKGIGIFGGLLHVTVYTQIFSIFICLLIVLILTLTCFYPKGKSIITFISLLLTLLVLASVKWPLLFFISSLDLRHYSFLVTGISSVFLMGIKNIYLDKEVRLKHLIFSFIIGSFVGAICYLFSYYSITSHVINLVTPISITMIFDCFYTINFSYVKKYREFNYKNLIELFKFSKLDKLELVEHEDYLSKPPKMNNCLLSESSNSLTNNSQNNTRAGATPSTTTPSAPIGKENLVASLEFKARCIQILKDKLAKHTSNLPLLPTQKAVHFADLSPEDKDRLID